MRYHMYIYVYIDPGQLGIQFLHIHIDDMKY